MEYRHIIFIFLSFLHVKAYTPVGYLGCYLDKSKRILDILLKTSGTNSGDQCKHRCSTKGYRYAGTKFGKQCHCGSRLKNYPKRPGCNIECPGNSDEQCGGNMRISIYDTWQCVQGPCQNNATCRDINATSYTCICTDGWDGQNCTTELPKPATLVTETVTATHSIFTSTLSISQVTSELRSSQLPDTTYSSSPGRDELTVRTIPDSANHDEPSLMIVYVLAPVGCVAVLIPVLITVVIRRQP